MTLLVCAAAAAACASSSLSPASPGASPHPGSVSASTSASTSPSAPAAAPAGSATREGCGDTPVRQGSPPAWATLNAPGSPFVLGREGNALGYLFTEPLRAGEPQNPANKILWYVREGRGSYSMRVLAHPRGETRPVVELSFPSGAGPGEIYPSITEMPEPGCWTLDLTWGANHDTVDLLYRR
ncbi:hypothetical protein [Sphaerisporangium sp. NPDC051011]|uniref:hypothetical protein n=1 Tax=Sphaerisporangium sp. NPDC051011 TaxID=3155792 RepID=UPI0034021B39